MADFEFDAAVDRDAVKHPFREPHPDDICVWADGTECSRSELEEYLTFMSDDFIVKPVDDEEVPVGWSTEVNIYSGTPCHTIDHDGHVDLYYDIPF